MTASGRAFAAEHGLQYREARPLPSGLRTVADAVAHRAATRPDDEVLVDRQRRLTGAELAAEVERAAAAFAAAGCEPYDRVAASLANSADVVIHFLAALRSGLVWVGINRALAPPEKAFQLRDSGARLLVTEADTAAALAPLAAGVELVDLDAWRGRVAAASAPAPPVDLDPLAPAAIAYTSGTTGVPKGAVHSQHSLLLPPEVVVHGDGGRPFVQGCLLPLTIINMQVLATVQTLLGGGSLIVMDRIDVEGVVEWIRAEGIERVYATPPLVHDLLTRPDVDRDDLASLVHLVVGGGKAPAGLQERFVEWFGEPFSHTYGLTEAPTGVTMDRRGATPPPGSAGVARLQVEVTIRDADGAVVAPGVDGEICLAPAPDGAFAGVFTGLLGYWDRPEATAATIVDGVIHTGDIGALDEQGYLYVRDRRSELINRGGANVYPAEVERVVEGAPGVAEVAVVGRPHDRLGEEVVAFVLASPGDDVDLADLDRRCRENLARYKVPVEWFVVDDLPRNAMGKVRKPLLRERLSAP